MTFQSKTYDKSSGRTYSDGVAGYDVPITALGLSLSFDTMETKSTIENLEGEIWKPILGYEGRYEASNKGRIKSLNYARSGGEKLLKLNMTGRYIFVNLCDGKTIKNKLVHRIIYEAFHGKLPEFDRHAGGNKMFVINHLDENKHNNCIENLELTTQARNNNYGTRLQRVSAKRRNGAQSKKVYQYDLDGILIKIWPSTAECGRQGFNEGHVASCCRNIKAGTYCNVFKDFIWSYSYHKKATKNKSK